MRPTSARAHDNHKPSLRALWRKRGVTALATLGVLTASVPAEARRPAADKAPATETILRPRNEKCHDFNAASLLAAPRLKAGYDLIARQPLTGAPLVQRLSNPAHQMQICADPLLPSLDGTIAAYRFGERRLRVPEIGADLGSIAHEAFHAYQHTLGNAYVGDAPLSPRDQAMALILSEAAAVGYTYMIMRESAFADDTDWKRYIANGGDYGMNAIFTSAFDRNYHGSLITDETMRRRLALAAGGTAVVEALLSNATPGWSMGYALSAIRAARSADNQVDATTRKYYETRDALFRRTAMVADISIMPRRLLGGAAADAAIVETLEKVGIETRQAIAPEFNPQRKRRP